MNVEKLADIRMFSIDNAKHILQSNNNPNPDVSEVLVVADQIYNFIVKGILTK